MRPLFPLLFAFTTVAAFAEPPAKPAARLDVKAIEDKLRGDWREIDLAVPREKQLRERWGLQWTMFKPADPTSQKNQAWITDHDAESEQTDGVLHINADKNPIWLDWRFRDSTGDYVMVGILRFEKGEPHWVLNKDWIQVSEYDVKQGHVRQRPTKFVDDKGKPIGYMLEPFTFGDKP
jgi:hypothetical protein